DYVACGADRVSSHAPLDRDVETARPQHERPHRRNRGCSDDGGSGRIEDLDGIAAGSSDGLYQGALSRAGQHSRDGADLRPLAWVVPQAVQGYISLYPTHLRPSATRADELSGAGLFTEADRGSGVRMRILGSEPFHQGISPHHGRNPPQLP